MPKYPVGITYKEGGPGSGHHGHAGIPGQRGGSAPGTGSGFAGSASFQDLGGAAARALPSGDIAFDPEQFKKMSDQDRQFTIAHEIVHQKIEDWVLTNEWDKMEKALTVKKVQHRLWGETNLLYGGNFNPGEAITDAIGIRLSRISRPDNMTSKAWDWAGSVVGRAGYDRGKLTADIQRINKQLSGQLEQG